MTTTTQAIVMRRTGPPEVLTVEQRALRPLAPGEVRLGALASAVNHSDLEIRAGNWRIRREPAFPYVPGLEVVGEIIELGGAVQDFAVGDRVWTTMQGLGGVRAERDGGYAERVTVDAHVLAPLPRDVDAVKFATIGLAGVTALEGIRRFGDVRGKTLLIAGSTGGVGSVAVEIGRALGADVVRLDRGSPKPGAGTVDAVLDCVAGPLFSTLVGALLVRGRVVLVP